MDTFSIRNSIYSTLNYSTLFNTSIPGISSPAKNLSVAPPPVDTCVTSNSETSAFLMHQVSPPPIIVFDPLQKAKAILLAILLVPFLKSPISNMPIGPIQTIIPCLF